MPSAPWPYNLVEMRKTWTEKFHNGKPPKIVVLEKPYMGASAGSRMLVASPEAVKGYIDAIPRGEFRTVAQLRTDLAKKFKADIACPTSTGIFVRIVSEVALEDIEAGKPAKQITPFWRVVDPESPAAQKLSCGPEFVAKQRAAETKMGA